MFLSKHKSGIYYLYYHNGNGKRNKISTRTKIKSEALKFLSNFNKESRKRKNSNSILLDEFVRKFLMYSETIHSPKTTRDYRNTFNQLKKYFGNPQLQDITTQQLNEFLMFRSKVSVYVRAKDLRYLKSSFNYAVDNEVLLDNPCKKIKQVKTPQKQPVFLDKDSYKKLLDSITNEDFKDLVEFAVNTGLRQMELICLEWKQINFSDKLVILDNWNHQTKSKKVRVIPLNDKAQEILRKRISNNHTLVFTYNNKQYKPDFITKKFKKIVLKTGLNPHLKWHSTRHTFASFLVQKGISIYIVSKLLGHADTKTTSIYAHLRPEDMRVAVDKLIKI